MVFTKLKKIGEGTYALVYEVFENDNEDNNEDNYSNNITKYAMKKFRHSGLNEGIDHIFIREISIMLECDHPNIVKCLYYDLSKQYFIMPLYHSNLKQYYRKNKIDTPEIKNISYQLLKGIHYLHSVGFAHRDIKPQNVLINYKTLEIVITDMGLGRRLDISNPCDPKTPEVCTRWYRPLEILLGDENYYYNIDIWSAGCLIAEMIFSKPILPGDSDYDQLKVTYGILGNSVKWEGIDKLPKYKIPTVKIYGKWKEMFKNVDSDLEDLLKNMISMNPNTRYSCAEALKHSFFHEYHKNNIHKNNGKIGDCCENHLKYLANKELIMLDECMDSQENIDLLMRNKLLDWLLYVVKRYDMSIKSFIRAQGILDRYLLNNKKVLMNEFQLLGVVCLSIGSKIEDIYQPEPDDLIYASDNIFDIEDLIRVEKEILDMLKMDIQFPTTMNFLSPYVDKLDITESKKEIEFMLIYIIFNSKILKYHPSVITMCCCLYVMGQGHLVYEDDNNDMDGYENYTLCMKELEKWTGQGFEVNMGELNLVKEYYPKIYKKY